MRAGGEEHQEGESASKGPGGVMHREGGSAQLSADVVNHKIINSS
jgi:hypothetical protein